MDPGISSTINLETPKNPPFKVKPLTVAPKEVRINPRELEASLEKEIRADERYQLINDAKLRALSQGTSTYEDFRQIWMGAHLKPMDKADKLDAFLTGSGSKVLWNSVAQDKDDCQAERDAKAQIHMEDHNNENIFDVETRTPQDLLRTWKKLRASVVKYKYLKGLLQMLDGHHSRSTLASLWMEEVPCQLLSEVIQVFLQVLGSAKNHDKQFWQCLHSDMLQILGIVSNSRRFGITLSFMSKTERNNIDELWKLLSDSILNLDLNDDSNKNLFNIIQARFIL